LEEAESVVATVVAVEDDVADPVVDGMDVNDAAEAS